MKLTAGSAGVKAHTHHIGFMFGLYVMYHVLCSGHNRYPVIFQIYLEVTARCVKPHSTYYLSFKIVALAGVTPTQVSCDSRTINAIGNARFIQTGKLLLLSLGVVA